MNGSGCWLGIDLGGTYIKWLEVADDGDAMNSGRIPTPTTGHHDVTRALSDLILERSTTGQRIRGVGIAVPGHLSDDRDSVTLLPNVPGEWLGYPLADTVAARTRFDPILLNDARAFALAELHFGAARGSDDVVFATIGTGVGGAVVARGTLVSTARDAFGEVGHITVRADGEPCGCGGRGCVEAYAGGTAILSRARRRGVPTPIGPDPLSALGLMADTDADAAGVLDEAYDAFALGIASACAFTGSRLVVVGGAVALELPGFLTRTRERLAERHGLLGQVEVRLAQSGPRAGALGAAAAASEIAPHAMPAPTSAPLTPSEQLL